MPQSEDDHAEILALIHANRIAIWTQDFAGYEKCFVHAPYTTRWGWWRSGGIFVRRGWDEIASRVLEHLWAVARPEASRGSGHRAGRSTRSPQ